MIRFKYPLEYELIPDILEKSTQWLTLRLKNVGDDSLDNLDLVYLYVDNPLVEVEYKGKQSNVILTTQGESTLKIFGE